MIGALILATCLASDLQQDLKTIDRRAAEITAVEARFTEKRYTTLLREPMERSGTIRAVAGVVRWDTVSPGGSTTVVTEDEVWIFYHEDPLLEIWELTSRVGQLASSPIPDVATLRNLFAIAPGESDDGRLTLLLTPLDHDQLEIDRGTGIVRRVVIAMVDGDRTEVVFDKIRLNPGISKADLALDVSPGTPIVRRQAPIGRSGP